MHNILKTLSLALCLTTASAGAQTIVNFTSDVVSTGYIGNGAQWDPYQLDYGTKKLTMTEEHWQTIYRRLDFMRPQLMRVVHNTASLMTDDYKLAPERNLDQVTHILDYCQSHGVTVIFGDWGWGLGKVPDFDKRKVELAADYVTWLIRDRGYSCIKYYNMVNEPNGFWSLTEGDYDMWRDLTLTFYNRLKKNKILDSITLVGPDVAIWTPDEVPWVERASRDVELGLYDIHTYPSKCTVNSGDYGRIIKAYLDAVPAAKKGGERPKMVMGEIGLKFVEPADSLYQQEMLRRAAARPYASTEDSQMFVFDYMYGTDMADAVMQTANAGFSGAIAWMLDDAMHTAGDSGDQLKTWGFWNILGRHFTEPGAEHLPSEPDGEAVRPWFYAWSLLTRFMPAGCDVYASKVDGAPCVKALKVKKDGRTMLAVLNTSKRAQQVKFRADERIANCKEYVYAEYRLNIKREGELEPNAVHPMLDLANGHSLEMPGESLFVFTDMD